MKCSRETEQTLHSMPCVTAYAHHARNGTHPKSPPCSRVAFSGDFYISPVSCALDSNFPDPYRRSKQFVPPSVPRFATMHPVRAAGPLTVSLPLHVLPPFLSYVFLNLPPPQTTRATSWSLFGRSTGLSVLRSQTYYRSRGSFLSEA